MTQLRIIHFLNQFFAGIGAEDKADTGFDWKEGAIGPGKRLQALLGESATIGITVYCGDNYFAEHHDEVLNAILKIARERKIEAVVAGPAFANGRYGYACAEINHFLSNSLNIYCLAGMHEENPGVQAYKQYKDRSVFTLPASDQISGMEDVLKRIAKILRKLNGNVPIGPAAEEGYIPRGFRRLEERDKTGVERAIDMLLEKRADRPFVTEIPVENYEQIPIPPAVKDVSQATIALASTSGVTLKGNPYGFKGIKNTLWQKYAIGELNAMTNLAWETVHGGYNTVFMDRNPNYGVPLDVLRAMEKESRIGKLYPTYYGTTGVQGWITAMKAIGAEMAADMKAGGVDGVLLVST